MDPEKKEESSLPKPASVPALWRRCVDLVAQINVPKTAKLEGALATSDVPDWKRPALAGCFVIVLAFGVLGGWSAFARLDSAVVAPGMVTLESSRKTIQHFEGGIISKILVHEGEHVEQGQVLFVFDGTTAQANVTAVRNQRYALRAQEARLVAERNGAQQIDYPVDLTDNASDPIVKDAINDENKQFAERRASLAGETDILNSRIEQLKTQIQGVTDQKSATEQQLGFINSELDDLRGLLAENLVQRTRVLALERERARLEGVIGQAVADIAKAQNSIGETNLQIEQQHKKFSEDVNSQILQIREKLADSTQKTVVSEDVLHRTQVLAPLAGTIQSLHVATIGGVVRPGEPLAELIPDNDNLVVEANVSPMDIDAIDVGMQAEVRFSAFHGYTLPIIMGRVDTVSRDRVNNEQTKQSYFLARIVVDKKDVPTVVEDRIRAGMPAEVIVPTGERTVISYLIRPLSNRAASAFREK
jgi:HlyD family type I secretion membrane fusion protein